MRHFSRQARIAAALLIGVLLLQQFPLDGRAFINNDHRSCTDSQCHCVQYWCSCDHCEHESTSRPVPETDPGPRVVPCHSTTSLPALVYSIDKTVVAHFATRLEYPSYVESIALPAETNFPPLPDEIFHPPRVQ